MITLFGGDDDDICFVLDLLDETVCFFIVWLTIFFFFLKFHLTKKH